MALLLVTSSAWADDMPGLDDHRFWRAAEQIFAVVGWDNGRRVWYNFAADPATGRRDGYECWRDARLAAPRIRVGGEAVSMEIPSPRGMEDIFAACMAVRGYSETK
jgi:hypothetical protein